MFLGVEGGGEHAVCEEEGGKTASDLQSHDPRQAFGLEGPSEWLVKGLPTFIILIFMKQTSPETTATHYKLKSLKPL